MVKFEFGAIRTFGHCSKGQSRDVKNMPMKSEGAMKISASRASKQAPTLHSRMTTPKYLSGQPLDRVWIKLARKGFCGTHTARSCGGLFGSSWLEWSPSALSFVRHFFTILTFLSEQCALTSWKLWQYSMLTPKSEISDYPLLQVNE